MLYGLLFTRRMSLPYLWYDTRTIHNFQFGSSSSQWNPGPETEMPNRRPRARPARPTMRKIASCSDNYHQSKRTDSEENAVTTHSDEVYNISHQSFDG